MGSHAANVSLQKEIAVLLVDRLVGRERGLSLFMSRGVASGPDAVRTYIEYIKFAVLVLEFAEIIGIRCES